MSIRCPVAALAILVGLFFCSSVTGGSGGYTEELPKEKLAQSFEKINAHLEKTVPGVSDPRVLMRELETLLNKKQSKCLNLGGKSLVRTLKLLVFLADLPSNSDHCDLFRPPNVFRNLDYGLVEAAKSRAHNYPLTKVELLIEHYAFESARLCARSRTWPTMTRGLKQTAYDYIDQQLVKQVPDSSEIDPNMEAAEHLLRIQLDQKGEIADALRQFLSLKWTPNSDNCNEEGFKRLLKNDLAVRGMSHLYSGHLTMRLRDMRRVDSVIFRFITKRATECGPILRNKILSALKSLDQDSYRKVLGLASTFFVSRGNYGELVDSANEKVVDEQFTLPLAIDYARKLVERCDTGGLIQVDNIETLNQNKLRSYVNTLMAKDRQADVYGGNGKKGKHEQQRQLVELLEKYLFTPCTNYLSKLDKLIEMDDYNYYADPDYLKSPRSEFIPNFNYHMARAANQACRYVNLNRLAIIENFKNYATKVLANGAFFWIQK